MIELQVIGHIESTLRDPAQAPKQGSEGAPDVWIEVLPGFADAVPSLQCKSPRVELLRDIATRWTGHLARKHIST